MKRISIAIAITILIAATGVANAQDNVSGTKHDLRDLTGQSEICISCHSPHVSEDSFTAPLWNHTKSTQTYTEYTSPTMAAPGGSPANDSISGLCLSCHDGTIAVGSYYNGPVPSYTVGTFNVDTLGFLVNNTTGDNPNMGTDLSNDHPVDMTYTVGHVDVVSGDLNSPGTIDASLVLFGDTIQCATCHNAHDGSNGSFLAMSNAGSLLCLECHVK